MSEPDSGNAAEVPSKETPAKRFSIESLVGWILLCGVLASILLLVVGTIWHWLIYGNLRFDYSIQGMNLWQFLFASLRPLASGSLRPRNVTNLGIAVLLLTPYVRVLASMVYFAVEERNWKYSLFTLFVFSVLTYSLFLR